ncbi:uncharacterized protein FIBRA_00824 [Fibroporia radiculosa]|uniref:F-box domain-containing protein n=1 Tax=Fibroporia radiculosa TaxID=599839 RepID=J4H0R7_9APHY|nr:uncharacterized protein FIBRA_00824 [Fibroporia radiculosa]CCL98819.1 predicted protein [Fibroporia radiculosa]
MSTNSNDSDLRNLPVLPTEVWEQVIDWMPIVSWYRRDLISCALTCRAWLPRSRIYLYRKVTLRNARHLRAFVQLLKAEVGLNPCVEELHLEYPLSSGHPPTRDFLGLSFPLMLARKLTMIKLLRLSYSGGTWAFRPPVPEFWVAMGEFKSVTTLYLGKLRFPTWTTFGQLVSSLPNLSVLICENITSPLDKYTPQAFVPGSPVKLKHIALQQIDITNNVVGSLLACTPVSGVERLVIDTIHVEQVEHLAKLLDAAGGSLLHLEISVSRGTQKKPLEVAIEDHRFVMSNTSLQSVRFRRWDDGGWIAMLLSHLNSRTISTVTIVFNSYEISDWLLDQLDCNRLDEALSQSKYAELQSLVFEYDWSLAAGRVRYLEMELQRRLPRAFKREILVVKRTPTKEWWEA